MIPSRLVSARLRAFTVPAFAALLLSTAAVAQDAKSLYDQSLVEGNSCKKMQLACQAAKIDPKKKEYQETCDRFRTATNRSDEMFRLKAVDALGKNDLSGATRWVNGFVCNADTKQSLLNQIAEAQKASTPAAPPPVQKADQSSTFLAEARSAYQSGNFDAAVSAAGKVTDANLKPIAEDIVSRVNSYRSAVAAAKQAEANKDYAGAINNWHTAQGINGNGPESPSTNIARLEPLAHPAAPPPMVTAQVKPPTPVPVANNTAKPNAPPVQKPVEDDNAKVARLLDEANKANASNNLQAALRAYEAVLRVQATNGIALAGKADVQKKINSDPAEQAKSLAMAIRDFYGSKYADAEDALRSYLDAPSAKSKGAAYFYLGATRLYEKVLSSSAQKPDTAIASAEVQRPFKDARAAGYQPVERLVSPIVLRAWRNAQ